jgi:UTP-glucose-1-phosphate uridylyltransferase
MTSKPALVVMAAGLGSRYGGTKQIEGVGPSGESLLEYAVFDARRAGFGRVVFIIREALRPAFEELVARLPKDLEIVLAVQSASDLPAWFPPVDRPKPWGTVHAVLAARDAVTTPFAVVNADDFYGATAYDLASSACRSAERTGDYAMIGLRLDRTLSEHGPVVRGIPATEHGRVIGLYEVRGIERTPRGIVGRFPDGERALTGAEVASMNCWVFTPAIFGDLSDLFDEFLREHGTDPTAESPLPEAIHDLVQSGRAGVTVDEAPGPWFGLTHADDRARVRDGLQALTDAGVYPAPLWEI